MRFAVLSAPLLVCLSLPVSAQELGRFGVRAGAGVGLELSDQEAAETGSGLPVPIAVGAAWRLDLSFAEFEVDLLYRREPTIMAGAEQFSGNQLTLPLLLKLSIPGVPFLHPGLGVEPRLLLSAEAETGGGNADSLERLVWYAPVSLGGTADLGPLALDIEARFEFQLSNHFVGLQADERRTHQLMLYVGGFF